MNAPYIQNPVIEFANVMKSYGLEVVQVIDDGKIHKCKCSHDKGNKTSGRYYLHSDGKANGEYGCYHDFDNALGCKWEADIADIRTEAEKAAARQQYAIKAAEREAQQLDEQANTAADCKRLWATAHDAGNAHPYLVAKGVNAYGVKELNGALLVPVYDGKGVEENLANLQFIQPDGEKRFKTGGKKQSCYVAFGASDSKTAVICEGYSTGASIAQATGYRVVVAFDAGNLLPVAQRIKTSLPDDWRVIVAADNDQWKESNTGVIKGKAAALAIGASWVMPCFDGLDVSDQPTDFNDLHRLAGVEAVRSAFENVALRTVESAQEISAQIIADESDDDFIKRLARLNNLEFARTKKSASERLGINQSDLKALVKAEQDKSKIKGESGTSILSEDIELWDFPVNGADLLDEVVEQLRLHVIADEETLHAAALWICLTWLVDYASVLPLAVITAPEKGCGKTTLLNAMMKMSCKPCAASGITSAALFRTIEAFRPTLFIDEADTFLKDNEELRGVINSGHTQDMAFVIRTVGDNFEPKQFSTWCAKAISGIGHLPETIESRSIILKMRRKVKGEHAHNIRHAKPETFTTIKRKLARWTDDNALDFSNLHPIMEGLNNRDADNYEPLLAIAMLAGDEWVQRIKTAARKLTATEGENRSIGVELLEACRMAFDMLKVDKIKTVELLDEICKDEEAPFLTYNRGKPMTAKQLSNRLRQYGIVSKTIRFPISGTAKGFEKSQFKDAFVIYLDGEGILSVTSSQPSTDAGLGVTGEKGVTVTSVTSKTNVTGDEECYRNINSNVTLKPSTGVGCDDVTGKIPEIDEKNIFPAVSTDIGGETWVL